jgi:hypothetical protein
MTVATNNAAMRQTTHVRFMAHFAIADLDVVFRRE